MSIIKYLPIMVAGACLAADEGAAQSAQRFSIQASGLYSDVLSNTVYTGIGGGAGFELQGRYTPGTLSFGGGFQWTEHGAAAGTPGADVRIFGGFVEPRYLIGVNSNNLAPYVSARFSILKLDVTSDGTSSEDRFHGSSTGLTLNGGGGLLVRLSPRFNLDIGATFGFTDFGELVTHRGVDRTEETLEGGVASNIVARIGLTFGIQ